MKVYGLDFTSAPSRRKPLVLVECSLSGGVLEVVGAEEMTGFDAFEAALDRPGPWVAGMDFPFGQPRSLVAALGWPGRWEDYVRVVDGMGKAAFEAGIKSDMATRPPGKKLLHRVADLRAGSSSAMLLHRVPVGKMFFRGAPRLLKSGLHVEPCRRNGDPRVAIEAYPALVARHVIGRASYKHDGVPDTPERRENRRKLVDGIESGTLQSAYGFDVAFSDEWRDRFIEEPGADALDSLLCSIQAAWSYMNRKKSWGIPHECDVDEGWIPDPATA